MKQSKENTLKNNKRQQKSEKRKTIEIYEKSWKQWNTIKMFMKAYMLKDVYEGLNARSRECVTCIESVFLQNEPDLRVF